MFTDELVIIKGITLEEVIKAKPDMIYYSANTAWWTHDVQDICHVMPALPKHLPEAEKEKANKIMERMSQSNYQLPTDPSGSPLFQTDSWKDFIGSAIRKKEAHGRHGLNAFMASHHQNCMTKNPEKEGELTHACFRKWDAYNDAIDNFIKERGSIDLIGNIKKWNR